MDSLGRLLILSFVEGLASVCTQRGLFFFTYRHLGFHESANLWLSLSFGVPYVLGAIGSHGVARRFSEKRLLQAVFVLQMIVHGGLALGRSWIPALFFMTALLGLLNGVKWPVIESYLSAGQDIPSASRSIARFNVAWASAVPLGMVYTGWANATWPPALFWGPVATGPLVLCLLRGFPGTPAHLNPSDPERPDANTLAVLQPMLTAARQLLFLSYICLWILGALLPNILGSLKVSDGLAPIVSTLLDASRLAAFVFLGLFRNWMVRPGFLGILAGMLAVGFFVTVLGNGVGTVLVGETMFGTAAGGIYYAALCFGMIVHNASVAAGGTHEALIGSGLILGPVLGLTAFHIAPAMGGPFGGMVVAVGPVVALLFGMAICHLVRARVRRNGLNPGCASWPRSFTDRPGALRS